MTATTVYFDHLDALAEALQRAGLWGEQRPSPEALASTQPFAVDTLALEEWLQFVFIPKLRRYIQAHQQLPENMAVTPMAEQVFGRAHPQVLHRLLILDNLSQQS